MLEDHIVIWKTESGDSIVLEVVEFHTDTNDIVVWKKNYPALYLILSSILGGDIEAILSIKEAKNTYSRFFEADSSHPLLKDVPILVLAGPQYDAARAKELEGEQTDSDS